MTQPKTKLEMFLHLRDSVKPAFAVLAGVQLDLFTELEDGPKTAEQLAERLEARQDKLEALLYVLVLSGYLLLDEEEFSNSAEASTFFSRSSDQYAGDMISALPDWWDPIRKTAESIKAGSAQAKIDYSGLSGTDLDRHYQSFYELSVGNGRLLASRYDFAVHHHLLDVGGGTGGVSIAIADVCPDLRVTIADLPAATPIAERFVSATDPGVQARISVVNANAVSGPLSGEYDAALMCAFMPVLGPEMSCLALKNVYDVLVPGSTLYVMDAGLLDNSRMTPVSAVQNGLWFINVFDNGGAHTEDERRAWIEGAGFKVTDRHTFSNEWGLLVARKPE